MSITRLALIGAGTIGKTHLNSIQRHLAQATVVVSNATRLSGCRKTCASKASTCIMMWPRPRMMAAHGTPSLPCMDLSLCRGERNRHAQLAHEATRVRMANPDTHRLDHLATVTAKQARALYSPLHAVRSLSAMLACARGDCQWLDH